MKDLGLQLILISQIDTAFRLRPVDDAWAAALAENIRQTHLRQPVEVRAMGASYRLISGGHRLDACKRLGWEKIAAFVFEATEDEARIAEIDENLVRHELNPLDRAAFLAERKAIYVRLYPETKHGAQGGKGGKRNETEIVSFSKDTADRIGLTDRTIRMAVMIAERLAPDVKASIGGTWIARTQKELLDLAKLAHAEQRAVLAMLLGDQPKARTVRQAMASLTGRTVKESDGYAKLMTAWRHASGPERASFLDWLRDAGVIDQVKEDEDQLEDVA